MGGCSRLKPNAECAVLLPVLKLLQSERKLPKYLRGHAALLLWLQ